jgi:hypothetical protein
MVNNLALQALIAACSEDKTIVDEKSARAAVAENTSEQPPTRQPASQQAPPTAPAGPSHAQMHPERPRRLHPHLTRRLTVGPIQYVYIRHQPSMAVLGVDASLGNVMARRKSLLAQMYTARQQAKLARERAEERAGKEYLAEEGKIAARLESEAAQQRRPEERAAQARLKEEQQAAGGAPDFHFDTTSQVRADKWPNGRVALIGDAACAAGPGCTGTAVVAAPPPEPPHTAGCIPGAGKGMSSSSPA